MDKYNKICLTFVFISTLFWISIILFWKPITLKIEFSNTTIPQQQDFIDLNDCYLTIHNFVSIHNNQTYNNFDQNLKFKSYIYSYTKPFLLELMNNISKDCLCY